jgi:hypothetical protein
MTLNLRLAYVAVAVAALLVLQGCWVCSLNPLNESQEDAAVDDRLIGVWCAQEEPLTLVIKRGDGKRYTFSYNEDEQPVTLEVHLAELGGRLFLDMRAGSLGTVPLSRSVHLLPVSTFLRADLGADKLELSGLSPSRTLKFLERRKDLAYATFDAHEDGVLFTASTDELRSWLEANSDNTEIFSDEVLVFERGKAANPGEEASCPAQQ